MYKRSKIISFFLIIILILSSLFCMAGCSQIDDSLIVKPRNHPASVTPEPAKEKISPKLWEVRGKDGKGKIFLFGSIHLAEPDIYPLDDRIMSAYTESSALAVEADIVENDNDLSSQLNIVKIFQYSDGTTIKDHISEETYNKAVELLMEHNLYIQYYDYFKPIMWISLIENITYDKSGLDAEYGIDRYFLNKAKEEGKKIIEIESVDFQINMLANLSNRTQELMLESYFIGNQDPSSGDEAQKALYEKWKSGTMTSKYDFDYSIFEFLNDDMKNALTEYHNTILVERNNHMVQAAESYLSGNDTVFYVVGAAHMEGETGIVEQLKAKGYDVIAK